MTQGSTSKPSAALKQRVTLMLLLYITVLTPLVTLYLHVIFNYSHTILMRRDENILLAMFQQTAGQERNNELFTMVIPAWSLTALHTIASQSTIIGVGRGLAGASTLICAGFTAAIARILFPHTNVVALLTLALLSTSGLFVEEGTLIRLNMPSMALTLTSIWLLLHTRPDHRRQRACLFAAGLLFGLAIQVKPLALAALPFLLVLGYRFALLGSIKSIDAVAKHSFPVRRLIQSALWYGAGVALPLALVLASTTGVTTGTQLEMHFGAATQATFVDRLSQSITIFWGFVLMHFWLILLWLSVLYLHFRESHAPERTSLLLLLAWYGSVIAVLIINYPTWDHHYIYALPPLAIGAAWAIARIAAMLVNQRQLLYTLIVSACFMLSAVGPFTEAQTLQRDVLPADLRVAAAVIAAHTTADARVWSDDLAIPLLTKRATDPWLVDVSIKRIIAGQLPEHELLQRFRQHPPAVVVVYDGLFDAFPRFIACVRATSNETIIALGGKRIYWVNGSNISNVAACQDRP